jgi:hypothetical protein
MIYIDCHDKNSAHLHCRVNKAAIVEAAFFSSLRFLSLFFFLFHVFFVSFAFRVLFFLIFLFIVCLFVCLFLTPLYKRIVSYDEL